MRELSFTERDCFDSFSFVSIFEFAMATSAQWNKYLYNNHFFIKYILSYRLIKSFHDL